MIWRICLFALLYYPLSIGLTFYQKWFIKSYGLPLLTVTGHYLIKFFAAFLVRWTLELCGPRRPRVAFREQLRWLAPIGICASLDIGLSNWALEYVTVSLYTMAKSSSILFIVAFSLFLRLERWRPSLGAEAALIAAGLFLFTWKSSQLDLGGLLLVLLASACTGVRWTVSQMVMQSDADGAPLRHPLDMVVHVQPWMLIPIVPLTFFFEGNEVNVEHVFSFQKHFAPLEVLTLIAGGGVIAFLMELSEYLLLVHTSGITLNIFGIVKEVMTLLLAHFLNGDRLSNVNILGLLLCLSGMFIHGASRRPHKGARATSPVGLAHQLGNSPMAHAASLGDESRKVLLDHMEDG